MRTPTSGAPTSDLLERLDDEREEGGSTTEDGRRMSATSPSRGSGRQDVIQCLGEIAATSRVITGGSNGQCRRVVSRRLGQVTASTVLLWHATVVRVDGSAAMTLV